MVTKEFKTAENPLPSLVSHTKSLAADGVDVALAKFKLLTTKVLGQMPTSLQFDIKGNGKYIGVGNGNLRAEPEVFEDKIEVLPITTKNCLFNLDNPEVAVGLTIRWRADILPNYVQWTNTAHYSLFVAILNSRYFKR